ncbi:MAG: hypothetical protein PHU27_07705 [Salinivirgaceae bacterium]|nr:hypothetical protein [Salinivirgaceae bacterium]
MARVLNFLEAEATAEEKNRINYYTNNNKQRTNSLEVSFSIHQDNRRKLYKLFGEWLSVFIIPAIIVYLLFQTPNFQTSDILLITGFSLFGICYTVWKLRQRKILRKILGDI